MHKVLFLAILLSAPTAALAEMTEQEWMDRDQDICFGANDKDECLNNGVANCDWVTKTETTEDGEQDVSWCIMRLPWTPKD